MDEDRPVGQIMNRGVVTVRSDARLLEAARLMREFHVSGLPVVDEGGAVTGILSEKDLVRDLHRAAGVASPRGLLDLLLESASTQGPTLFELCRHRLERGRVADVMSARVVTVAPTTPLRELAARMERDRLHRLPVVDAAGTLVGIVSRGDVVAALAGVPPPRERGALRPGPNRRGAPRTEEDPYSDA